MSAKRNKASIGITNHDYQENKNSASMEQITTKGNKVLVLRNKTIYNEEQHYRLMGTSPL
jgi:hypothetical protein